MAQRYQLREVIEREAVAWAVGIVTAAEIDKMNILRASFLAMHRAVDGLKVRPQHLLIDGNKFTPYKGITHNTVVKGSTLASIEMEQAKLSATWRPNVLNAQKP